MEYSTLVIFHATNVSKKPYKKNTSRNVLKYNTILTISDLTSIFHYTYYAQVLNPHILYNNGLHA
jgi:hypothetical protein